MLYLTMGLILHDSFTVLVLCSETQVSGHLSNLTHLLTILVTLYQCNKLYKQKGQLYPPPPPTHTHTHTYIILDSICSQGASISVSIKIKVTLNLSLSRSMFFALCSSNFSSLTVSALKNSRKNIM